jgi:hypothetical protein
MHPDGVSQRRALGVLFLLITLAFAGIAIAAAGAGVWPVAIAAAVLGVWMSTLVVRALL